MSKIFIIGNGFDISMGMKTSYEHFLNSEYFIEFKKSSQYLAKFIENDRKIRLWIDLEEAMATFSHSNPNINFENDYEALRNSLKMYISSIECQYISGSLGIKLLKEKFNPGDQIHVFNYTSTVHEAFKKISIHSPDGYVHYVHGSIDKNDIIFGIDENQNYHIDHAYILKSAHDNFAIRQIKIDLDMAQEVYWFGHSLGKSDAIYFKNMFTGLLSNRIQTPKKLYFFHYGESEKKRMIARITELCEGRLADLKSKNDLIFCDSSRIDCPILNL